MLRVRVARLFGFFQPLVQGTDGAITVGQVLLQSPQLVANCGLFIGNLIALSSFSIQFVLQSIDRVRQFG